MIHIRETPAQRQARLAGPDIDSRSLALARQIEGLFAREWRGGPGQRQAAVQVLIGEALRGEPAAPPKARVVPRPNPRFAPIREEDVIHEVGAYVVYDIGPGFEVHYQGPTVAKRVAFFGAAVPDARDKAIAEAERLARRHP